MKTMTYEDWIKLEPLPHWVKSLSNGHYMQVGAHLATKDGRRCGNSVVVHVRLCEYLYRLVAECVTDAGNTMTMSLSSLEDYFYRPKWIHTAKSINIKLKAGERYVV